MCMDIPVRGGSSGAGFGIAMPLHLEGIAWMASPPLVPMDPIDARHLQRMTLGDAALEREVLALFSLQAARLVGELDGVPAGAASLAHTLKGSALGVGAFAVAEAAEWLETELRAGGDIAQALPALHFAVTAAREAIEARLEGG
jgi:HPt (histidine-containing phosphotransfer) domain-containing protein